MPNVEFNNLTDNVTQKANDIEKSMSKRAVVLIWATWCHHCVSMKPEWERVKSDMAKDDISFVEIESANIDRLGNTNPGLMRKISPTSQIYFPMIKTVAMNTVKDYEKDRSYDTMKSTFKSLGKAKAAAPKAKPAAPKAKPVAPKAKPVPKPAAKAKKNT